MKRKIARMANHMIICGYGRMGREVCRELQREGKSLVVIDYKEESVHQATEAGHVVFQGDPGMDETLIECGILRAAGLAAASDDDARNLMVVISARGLNPKLPIVARVSAEDAPGKFIRAGADRVFLPYRTGGSRLAQMMVRPDVVGFLEDILHESSVGILIENLTVEAGSELEGQSLAEARIRERTGVYIMGIKRPQEGLVPDLKPTTVLKAGDTLIVIGKKEFLDEFELMMASRS